MNAIGVDFGGTWIRAGLVDTAGACGDVHRVPTGAHREPAQIIDDLTGIVEKARQGSLRSVRAVGITIPTTLDDTGRLDPCPNLPTMSGFPVVEELSRRLDSPVWLENDARCFVLGEWRFGAGQGKSTVLGITLGTSIGLGIVQDGHLVKGEHGQAGEIWRSPTSLEPDAPRRNLHDALRGEALEETYQALSGRRLPAVELGSAARSGDAHSRETFRRYGIVLGEALVWLTNVLDPDLIVIGGSVANDFNLFAPPAAATLDRAEIELSPSALGDRAAIQGAAFGATTLGEIS